MCLVTIPDRRHRKDPIKHTLQRYSVWRLPLALACVLIYTIDSPAANNLPAVPAAVAALAQETASPARRARVSATLRKARPAIARNVRIAPASGANPAAPVDPRAAAPVVGVTDVGPGQAGYVHFFLVRAPADPQWEIGVGIELPDQRIAWSFLDLGVIVSPFIENGVVPVRQKHYEVQYMYGLRPFPDAAAMRVLQSELEARVLPYAEAETPYCILRGPSDPACVSCLGFVLRLLFPGATPAYALLPHDFDRAALKTIYTTDDLLLYLTGMNALSGKDARLKRADALALPENMREDVVRLLNAMPAGDNLAEPPAPTGKPAPQRLLQPGKS